MNSSSKDEDEETHGKDQEPFGVEWVNFPVIDKPVAVEVCPPASGTEFSTKLCLIFSVEITDN